MVETKSIELIPLKGKYTEIKRGTGHDNSTYIMFKNEDGSNMVITNDVLDVLDKNCQVSFRQWINDWTK